VVRVAVFAERMRD